MFRVATFNLLNLNAVGHEFFGRPSDLPYTSAQFATKTKNIVDILNKIDCHVVGFQEVFSEKALDQIVQASRMKGAKVYAPTAKVLMQTDGTPAPGYINVSNPVSIGPHVGLAVSAEIKSTVRMIENFPAGLNLTIPSSTRSSVETLHHISLRQFERPILRAELEIAGLPGLVVFVAHLKSKLPKFLAGEDQRDPLVQALGNLRSLVVRAAEAAALRGLVTEARGEWIEGKRRPVIVLGDLNDDMTSVTTSMISGNRPWAREGQKAQRLDYARLVETLLMSAYELKGVDSPDRLFTHVHNGVGSIIDLILLSSDFAPVPIHQRASVIRVAIENTHLGTARLLPSMPVPEDFSPTDTQSTDPLAAQPPKSKKPKAPELGLDHGVVWAEIEVL